MFKNCRIIGRRFRLAHVLPHEVIETSTFRARFQKIQTRQSHIMTAADGLVMRDNLFGTLVMTRCGEISPSISLI